uniref:CHK domain-containing protein n=1 Tax=Rhabditophanes sp. KR3021 TaxID=114890 RepID=A0AC35U2X2_9BILA
MPGASIVIDDSTDEIAIERDLHMLAHNREVFFLRMLNIFVDNEFGSKFFGTSNITNQWIVDCLIDKNEEFNQIRGNSKILSMDGYDISGGKGFLSKVYKTTITFENNGETYVFVTKIPGTEAITFLFDNVRIEDETAPELPSIEDQVTANLHNREVEFYDKLIKILPGLQVPKCFGFQKWIVGKQEGCILMEYLGEKAMMTDSFIPFTLEQTKSVLDQIFILQSKSLINKHVWKGKYPSMMENSDTTFVLACFEGSWNLIKSFVTEDMYKDIDEDAINLAMNHEQISLNNRETMLHNSEKTITHGDMWCNNLCRKNDQSSNELGVIIDWQTFSEGSLLCDIACTLVLNTTSEIRRHCFEFILPEYFGKLKMCMEQNNIEFKMTWEECIVQYHYSVCEQAIIYVVGTKMLVDSFAISGKLEDDIWKDKLHNLGVNVCLAMREAIEIAKRLKPEWLVRKNVE